jgi:PAS domain S-box-containing protein
MKTTAYTSTESLCKWIFEYAGFGIIITDQQLTIIDANRWILDESGRELNELAGTSILEAFPEIRERNLDHYLTEALNGASVILSARFHKYFLRFPASPGDDTKEMRQTVRISPVIRNNNQEGLIIHLENVTDRVLREEEMQAKNEELQKLNTTKDKFFRIIAHDLRSPFTALLGFSELLKDNPDYTSEQSREIINTLHEALKDQFDFLENLLKWAQLQTGHFDLVFEEVKLSDVISYILRIAVPVIRSKEIEIVNDDRSTDIKLNTDRQAITSVLYNIIFNALKFTNVGGTIEIWAAIEKDIVNISVRDNGVGIPADRINKLFRIDESVSTPGTKREKGSGLGLILVKELVDKLGGKILIDSTPGVGSTFTVSLPGASVS